jgi:dolichyl-phosphate-mannose-protein mannosyltransferase
MSRRTAIICLLVILSFSAAVRLAGLDSWHRHVFDERYYAHDAAVFVAQGLHGPDWRVHGFRSQAHPLLGFESIAAGIALFGNSAWGWRLPSALAGIAVIALVYPLARRLLLSRRWAVIATALTAADTLLIVQSRVGMLDMFVVLWSTLCIYFALRAARSRSGGAWWLVLCGVAGGLAAASKWSGALALVAAAAVFVLWRRRKGVHALWVGLALTVVPCLVYLVTWVPYFADGHSLAQWAQYQHHMASFGMTLHTVRSYASPPERWLFDFDATWYTWKAAAQDLRGIVAIGNPLVWWGGTIGLVALAVLAVKRRSRLLALPALLVLCLYVPWLFTGRTTYLFYMLPIIPFLAVVLARALSLLRMRCSWALAVPAAVPLLAWMPFLVSLTVPYSYYEAVMLLPSWR